MHYELSDEKKKDYAYADLKSQYFTGIKFRGADFSNTDLTCTEFENCLFCDCAIVNPVINQTRFSDVSFEGCKLIGMNFYQSNPFSFAVKFNGCRLLSCNFTEMRIRGTVFHNSGINECFFEETDLSSADFSGCKFSETLFHHTNLSGASFRDASGYNINPVNNNLKKAVFSVPDVLNLLGSFGIKIVD